MLIKTHLAIALCLILLLIPYVNHPFLFLTIGLLSAYLPDIDSKNSKIGNYWYLRPFQWFVKHRGFVHSFSFLFLIVLLMSFFAPLFALPFFVGYSSHLVADSFTLEGITPFYPFRKKSRGSISTGGANELNVLVLFVFLDFVLLARHKFFLGFIF